MKSSIPSVLVVAVLLIAVVSLVPAGCPSSSATLDDGSLSSLDASEAGAGDAIRGADADTSALAPAPVDVDSGSGRDSSDSLPAADSAGGRAADGVASGDSTDGIQSGTLTAGDFDDNLNLDVFRKFLSDLLQKAGADSGLPAVKLGQRAMIRVQTEAGDPVNNARTIVLATDSASQNLEAEPAVYLDQVTGTDGRVAFFTGIDGASGLTSFTLRVYPPEGTTPVTQTVSIDQPDWSVTLAGVQAEPPKQLDLLFVIDATGSMDDELKYIKVEVTDIAAAVRGKFPDVEQRFGLIVYRDDGDDYVSRTFPFTSDLDSFTDNLSKQSAAGGGDWPEAVHVALQDAVKFEWSTGNTARVMFLVADAPPHAEFHQVALDAVMDLRAAGVSIYGLGASGVAAEGEFVLRTAALLTLGEYLFLTDDSSVGNSHDEPHIPCYTVQRLDQLMIRMIAAELAGERIEADPKEIIRTVGNPVKGVCTTPESQ